MAQIFEGLTAILNDVWDAITHALRVEPASGSFPVSGIVVANQGTPNTPANAWPVTLEDARITGSLTATNQTVVLPLNADGLIVVDVEGVWTSTVGLAIEVTDDPTLAGGWVLWSAVIRQSDFGVINGNLSSGAIGAYSLQGAGWTGVRCRARGTWTGTANIQINGSASTFQPMSWTQWGNGYSFPDAVSTSSQVVYTAGAGNLAVYGRNIIYGKTGSATADVIRTPAQFKTVQATGSGSTALWTPVSGKKFRLMRYRIDITDDAALAVAGRLTVSLLDSAASIAQSLIAFVPAAALDTAGLLATTGWIDLGNGILSAAANNVLNVNLSAALTAGLVNVVCCGTEE